MDTVLIIGAGAAGSVVAQKCAMDRDTFKHITLASRRTVWLLTEVVHRVLSMDRSGQSAAPC